jgi:dCTP deaminase
LDIFTRVITDNGSTFDEIPFGYSGQLYLEIVPRTFTIKAQMGETLNQLRLIAGTALPLGDEHISALHDSDPLLYDSSTRLPIEKVETNRGLFVPLYLGPTRGNVLVGYQAKENSDLVDLSRRNYYRPGPFWEKVMSERGARVVLQPEKFYLLLSQDRVAIPPDYASEMTAYDPTSGELRTHYAGFFDPGFGYGAGGELRGSQAALEVRAHDVPFAVEHGQNICKLSFERMIERPSQLYGADLGSNYQGQVVALGKHFKRDRDFEIAQPELFDT